MNSALRNSIAATFRTLPYFRGKRRLGLAIGTLLTNNVSEHDCITIVKMQDGSFMQLDVRSRTEQWSYWTGDYDGETIARLSSCLNEKCVVFDVGANIGFYSTALGFKVKSLNGVIHAFEPVKSNFDRLLDNTSLNDLKDTVISHQIALGDEEKIIDICLENENNAKTGNAVIVQGNIKQNHFNSHAQARLTRLDTFVKQQQIKKCDLIKIDIEGAEVMFLRGGTSFLSQQRPIIYGEFNAYFLRQLGHSFLDVVEIVKPWNYRFFKQARKASFIEVKQPTDGLENVLLTPAETSDSLLKQLGVLLS